MTYDAADKSARFAERRGIGFPILSDPKSEIIRAFDLLDERYALGSYGHGIAHPITFVIDADGVIRRRFSGPNYRRRPEADQVLEILRQQG